MQSEVSSEKARHLRRPLGQLLLVHCQTADELHCGHALPRIEERRSLIEPDKSTIGTIDSFILDSSQPLNGIRYTRLQNFKQQIAARNFGYSVILLSTWKALRGICLVERLLFR